MAIDRRAGNVAYLVDESSLKCIIKLDSMFVCLCVPTRERDVDQVIDDGARSVEEIGERCGAGTGCGSCRGELRERLAQRGAAACSTAADCPDVLVPLRSR